jgi:two-component system phosphate regulon response regulator PhoB/two-component system alkaline phosphatase synthesis response regulator PhoP
MKKLIAIVDDEPDIVELVSVTCRKAGFVTSEHNSARSFFETLPAGMPDLVVLDLMLPDIDGLEVCKLLKKRSETCSIPIIMLTVRSDETDKVLGLELGADDYVTKPFSPRELLARIKAVLRRHEKETEGSDAAVPVRIRDVLEIDPGKYKVLVEGRQADLTTTEFRILHLLATHRETVFTRDQLLDHLWGTEKAVIDRTIDVHIKNLRDKLGIAGRFIKNVRGVGYKFEA